MTGKEREEEMSELTKEICKNFRGAANANAIAEEIADVQIMCEQMAFIFDEQKVAEQKKFKLERLAKRVEEADKKKEQATYLLAARHERLRREIR